MPGSLEKLSVQFATNIRTYQRDMASASKATQSWASETSKAGAKAEAAAGKSVGAFAKITAAVNKARANASKPATVAFKGDTRGLTSAVSSSNRQLAGFFKAGQRNGTVLLKGDARGLTSALSSGQRQLSGFRGFAQRAGQVLFKGDASALTSAAAAGRKAVSSFASYAKGAAQVTITGDASPLARATSFAKAQLSSLEGYMGSLSGSGSALTSILGIAGVAGGMGLVGSAAVGMNNRLEQAKIGFSTMLGSGKAAGAFLQELRTFAAQTPFEFPDLVTASQRMLAFGFEAKEVKPLLTGVGNAASAMGSGAAGIDAITYALGQMKAGVTLQLGEMNQLTEQGVPAFEILAQKIGVSTGEVRDLVSAGDIKADTFIAGFQEFAKANYGGMMAAQAKTAGGAFSTLKDNLQNATADAFRPGFLALTDLTNLLAQGTSSEGFQNAVSGFSSSLEGGIQKAKDFASQVQLAMNPPATGGAGGATGEGPGGAAGFIGGLLSSIQGAIPAVKSAFSSIMSAAGPFISQIGTALKPALDDIMAGFRAMQPAAAPVAAFLTGVLQGALAAIVPILVMLARVGAFAFRQVATAVGWVGSKLQPFLPQVQMVGKVIGFVFANVVGSAVGVALRVFGALVRVIPVIGRVAGPIFSLLGRAVMAASKPIQTLGKGFSWLGSQVGRIASSVVSRVKSIATGISSFAARGRQLFGQFFSWVGNAFKSGFSRLISTVTGWANRARATLTSWGSKARGVLQTALNFIGNIFRTTFAKIASTVTSWANRARQTLSSWGTSARNLFNTVWNWVTSRTTTAANKLGEIVTGLKEKAISIFNALKSGVGPIFSKIATAMTSPIEAARSTLQGIWNSILEGIAKVLSAVGLGGLAGKLRDAKWTSGGGSGSDVGSGLSPGGQGNMGRAKGGPVQGTQLYTVGEAGRREYVINPNRPDNVKWLGAAAGEMGYGIHRRNPGASRDEGGMRGSPGYRSGMGEGLGATHYNVDADVRAEADRIAGALGLSWNTYAGHGLPGGSTEDRTVDFWGPGGRGAPISTSAGYKSAEMVLASGGPTPLYIIRQGEYWRGGSWQGWPSDPHYDHTHVSYMPGDGSGTTGGTKLSGDPVGSLWASAGEALWDRLVQKPYDNATAPLEDGFVLRQAAKGAGQKALDGIKEMIISKSGSTGGSAPAGSSPKGLTIGEALSQGGWPGDLVIPASGLVFRESSGRADVVSSAGAIGLMQIMPTTAQGVGADPNRLKDPIYNTNTGYKVYQQAGGFGPWDAAPGGDYRSTPVTGYRLGGVIPGAAGFPKLLMAHAGERVLSRLQTQSFDRLTDQVELWNRRGTGALQGATSPDDAAAASREVRDEVKGLRADGNANTRLIAAILEMLPEEMLESVAANQKNGPRTRRATAEGQSAHQQRQVEAAGPRIGV